MSKSNIYKLTIEQLRSYIAESLIKCELITIASELVDVDNLQTAKIKSVDKYDENTIRAFSAFKFELTVKNSRQRNYDNTDNELFERFCIAYNDNSKHLKFDDRTNKFVVTDRHLGNINSDDIWRKMRDQENSKNA